MKQKLLFSLLIPTFAFASKCQLVNQQCMDNAPTKTINGITFSLADMCNKLGLTGSQCCWNNASNYYCGDQVDTCGQYRKNANCSLVDNTCIDKDYITGNCNKFQSKYTCAGGYQDVESRVCTNVVCANNESGTASKCYSPPQPSNQNINNMGAVVAYMQLAQNMAQDMQCSDLKDTSTCTIFSGSYFNCYMYMFKADQPGSWNNNGADCMVTPEFFTQSGVPTGYAASDHNLYSQATSGTNNVMGGSGNYSLASDDSRAINNTIKLQQQSKAPVVNQDEQIHYTPNNSTNHSIAVNNGQVLSVTINKDTIKDISGFSAFKSYLTDKSVNLAWNRQKAEPDPSNIKNITFSDEQISRSPRGRPFGWNSGTNQPIINGLCIHLADSCEGGDDNGTVSDFIKLQLAWAGGFTNPNFCAKCTSQDPVFGNCLTGEPRNVKQEWCCFTSKASMDINLAAYDQGLLDFYTGNGSRYGEQVQHPNGICGGVTVGMISKIDFSKGNYFKDLIDSVDVSRIIDSTIFTNPNIQNNTYGRSNTDANQMVNDYMSKQ